MRKRADWNTDRDNELRADRQIAEVHKRIARQRAIVESAIDKGRPSVEAESLLRAFEASRRALEKHRELVLDMLANAGPNQNNRRLISARGSCVEKSSYWAEHECSTAPVARKSDEIAIRHSRLATRRPSAIAVLHAAGPARPPSRAAPSKGGF